MERDAKRRKVEAKLRKDRLRNSVSFKGHRYATLDFAEPGGDVSNGHGQDGFVELPHGWEISPHTPEIVQEIVAKHTWQTAVILFANGNAYAVKGYDHESLQGFISEFEITVQKRDNTYGFGDGFASVFGKHFGARILIRTRDQGVAQNYRSQMATELWKTRRFTDCTVVFADAEERCHRAVLAAASPVFDKMFSSGLEEAVEQRVVLQDVQSEIGRTMLRFMYMGEIDESFSKPIDLLGVAHMYQLDKLMPVCAQLILDNLSVGCVADAIRTVKNLRDNPDMEKLWSEMTQIVKEDSELLATVMMTM